MTIGSAKRYARRRLFLVYERRRLVAERAERLDAFARAKDTHRGGLRADLTAINTALGSVDRELADLERRLSIGQHEEALV